MGLATPKYEQYPTPSKPSRRPTGGGRQPRGGSGDTPTPPVTTNPWNPTRPSTPQPTIPTAPSTPQPNPWYPTRPDTPQPNPWYPTRPDDYGPGRPGQINNLTYDQMMALDFTGMGSDLNHPTIGPQRRAEQAANSMSEQRNSIVDQFDAWSNTQSDSLLSNYNLGVENMTALYDLNKDVLQQGLNTDLGLLGERQYRDVGLAREQLAGQQADLSQYYDILAQRMGIRRDMFKTDRDYFNSLNDLLGQERGLAYDKFQSNDAYLAGSAQDNLKQYGFATRDFKNDIAGARLSRDTSRRAATSSAAGTGAFGSAGFRDNITDIMSQYGLNADAAQLGVDRAYQQIGENDRAIGNDRSNLRFGYEGQVIGFDRDAAGLTRSAGQNYNNYRDDLQGFRKQRVDLDSRGREMENTGKALDSLAREYGIKRSDIENQFSNAVTRLGLDAKQTREQLEQMLNSGNQELIMRGMEFMNQMMVFQ